jgi:hypothetical protein
VANDDTGIMLELYKTAVEMADRVSARRASTNTFFLTLNTALAATVGIISAARKPPARGVIPVFDSYGLVLTAIAGIVLSLTWRALLRYYRRLNAAKWDVINKLELKLPSQPFTDEWAILHPSAEGKDESELARWWHRKVKHREATVVEQVVPIVFMLIYLAVGLRVILQ